MQTESGAESALTPVQQVIERYRTALDRTLGVSRPTSNRRLAERTADRDPAGKGVHHVTLGYTINGKREADLPTLLQLARALSVADPAENASETERIYADLVEATGRDEVGPSTYIPPDTILELNRYERLLVDSLINGIAAAKRRGRQERERLDRPRPTA